MSRRSRRDVLVRVAEARATLARRDVAAGLREVQLADEEARHREALLAAAGLAGGSREALELSTSTRLLRAAALHEAHASVRSAVLASDAALAAWTEARRGQRLMEQLRDRERQERADAQLRLEQRDADDLAGHRREDW